MKIINKYLIGIIAIHQVLGVSKLYGAETKDVFEKVFGTNIQKETMIKIDVTLGEFILGEVDVVMDGNELKSLSGDQLNIIMLDKIRDEKKNKYLLASGQVSISEMPFQVHYHPSDLRVSIEINPGDLKPISANVYDDLIPYYSKQAALPAEFSMGLNYKLEQSFNHNNNQEDAFFVQTDSFINLKDVTIENQMNYLSSRQRNWNRQRTTAIYDRPNSMQRYQAGDIQYPIIGYLEARPIGGLALYKDFSLNPYRQVHATSSYEYQLESRSLVKTYVNNIFLKAEYMSAGRYGVKDIPLNNGINTIKVEVVDGFGVEKVYVFNESGSLDILHEGVNRYSMALGYRSYFEEGMLKYKTEDLFVSGFYQLGQTKKWTFSGYGQGDNQAQLIGTNHLFSTSVGNFSFDLAGNRNPLHSGSATQITYQLNLFGAYWYDSHTLTSKLEYRSPFFNESGEDFRNRYDVTGALSYNIPLFEKLNFSVGGNYQNPSLASNASFSYNASLNTKLFDSSSLTFYFGKSRDEYKEWSNQMYVFFNMSFGASSSFVSAFYEKETDTKRLTAIRDTGNKYNDLKIVGQVDDGQNNTNGSLDLQYNSLLADLGARQEVVKSESGKVGHRTTLRLLSSLAFIKQDGESAFSIGRPINNSFAIFKPAEGWEGQTIGVQSASLNNESSSGPFGEILVSNLTPYQYRRLQLDTSLLDPGFVLGQESFVVYPRKNSGHLFVIGKKGLLILKGRLLDETKEPMALKIGAWISEDGVSIPFFTDRDGVFFVEGVEAKNGYIKFEDKSLRSLPIELISLKSGIVDLGEKVILKKESDM